MILRTLNPEFDFIVSDGDPPSICVIDLNGDDRHVFAISLDAARFEMSWMPPFAGGINLIFDDFLAVFVATCQQRARFIFHLPFQVPFSPSSSGQAPAIQEEFDLPAIAETLDINFLAFLPGQFQCGKCGHGFVITRLSDNKSCPWEATDVEDAILADDGRIPERGFLAAVIESGPIKQSGEVRPGA